MAKALAALMLGLCLALSNLATAADKKQPDWSQLTPEQQQILAPLANEWKDLDDKRRKKWLLTAKRYPSLTPEQQQRLQTKMQDWAKLTPEQRRIARENYKKLAKQPPEKREAVKRNWTEEQQRKQPKPQAAHPAPTAPVEGAAAPGASVAPRSITSAQPAAPAEAAR